jgi:hypothetical protein
MALHQSNHDYVQPFRDFFIFTRGSRETDPGEPFATWPRKTSCWILYPADWELETRAAVIDSELSTVGATKGEGQRLGGAPGLEGERCTGGCQRPSCVLQQARRRREASAAFLCTSIDSVSRAIAV